MTTSEDKKKKIERKLHRVTAVTITVMHEHLERCNGECQVKVKNVAKEVAKRLDISKTMVVAKVNETLENHPCASFYRNGWTSGKATHRVDSRIYQLKERTTQQIVEEYSAASGIGG